MKFHICWYSSDSIMTGSTIGLWWWCWWIVFVVQLTTKRCIALFPAGTTVRDPQHHESRTGHEQDLNLRKTWIQTLVEWSCTVVMCKQPHIQNIYLAFKHNFSCFKECHGGDVVGKKKDKVWYKWGHGYAILQVLFEKTLCIQYKNLPVPIWTSIEYFQPAGYIRNQQVNCHHSLMYLGFHRPEKKLKFN